MNEHLRSTSATVPALAILGLLVALLAPPPAAAIGPRLFPDCQDTCTTRAACSTLCSYVSGYEFGLPIWGTQTCLSHGFCTDIDQDSIDWSQDNCPVRHNPDQLDCDQDGVGDVCDPDNGTFVYASGPTPCFADVDEHLPWNLYIDVEIWQEVVYQDVSSCGSPNRADITLAGEKRCHGESPETCCMDVTGGIPNSAHLCTAANINRDFCTR